MKSDGKLRLGQRWTLGLREAGGTEKWPVSSSCPLLLLGLRHIHAFIWKWDPTNKRKHTLSDFLILTPFPYYDYLQLYFFSGNGMHNCFSLWLNPVPFCISTRFPFSILCIDNIYQLLRAMLHAITVHVHMHLCDMSTCSKDGTAGPHGSSTSRPWGTSAQTSIVGNQSINPQ